MQFSRKIRVAVGRAKPFFHRLETVSWGLWDKGSDLRLPARIAAVRASSLRVQQYCQHTPNTVPKPYPTDNLERRRCVLPWSTSAM